MELPQICIPGTFVVFQGVAGDGFCNTIDYIDPLFYRDESDDATEPFISPIAIVPEDAHVSAEREMMMIVTPSSSPSPSNAALPDNLTLSNEQNSFDTQLSPPPSMEEDTDPLHVNRQLAPMLEQLVEETESAHELIALSEDTPIHYEDDVTSEMIAQPANEANSTHSPPLDTALQFKLEEWRRECREQELHHRQEWCENTHSSPTEPSVSQQHRILDHPIAGLEPWWLTPQGTLALWQSLPLATQPAAHVEGLWRGAPSVTVIDALPPGTVVRATALYTVRSDDWVTPLAATAKNLPPTGRRGWVQLLKLEAPRPGYCVLNVDGYSFLGPGLPQDYIPGGKGKAITSLEDAAVPDAASPEEDKDDDNHHCWYWRVMCLEGAFVRNGVDLTADHVATIPYGSLVRVLRKTVNAMALSRLQIEAVVYHEQDEDQDLHPQHVAGWISEFLNPLSGQRGPIVLPLPFPAPALFKVTLPNGAVIRSDIELSSPVIGHAAYDSLVSVTGCLYTEQPKDQCVARYRLAGHGGYISVRLNVHPPQDRPVVAFTGLDPAFAPHDPGLFHWSLRPATPHAKMSRKNSSRPPNDDDDVCVICLCESRSATMIHGDTGHIACCLICARILQARGDVCPVCRLPIERVIQHFWA